jgi:hypothetical protein
MLKNVAAPGLCLDVAGASTANGAKLQLYTCNNQNNQLFAVEVQ